MGTVSRRPFYEHAIDDPQRPQDTPDTEAELDSQDQQHELYREGDLCWIQGTLRSRCSPIREAIERSWAELFENFGGHETLTVKDAIPAGKDAVVAITEFKIIGDGRTPGKSSVAEHRSR